MPEVAEIALTADILEKNFKNCVLESFDFTSGRYTKKEPIGFKTFNKNLPMKLKKINSKGKFMWFEFKGEKTWYVWNTFGLTGMWALFEPKYTRAVLSFKDDKTAYFSDMRNFGTFKFSDSLDELEKKLMELGPDFLKDDDFNIDKITKYKTPVVKLLMDQKKIGSGLGNYLVAEILYRAKLSPHRLGSSLSNKEVNNLAFWIKYVVKLAYVDNHIGYMVNLEEESDKIKKKNYHSDIKLDDKEFKFLVYRQKKDPLGNPVKAEKIVGSDKSKRTTYWVPAIQK
ncbi:formamidopyrimidine-DNA glycosylase [Acanthamoeba polyphaga mimivirus]|uniref:Formamidopyrimidine-DNA glycosylase n=4 Tax=Megamimivirinae TaxID=3044648 RepID=A0A2L2DMN9_MIMIV|nr:putative formamidopyrimidine-DNA glycosylase [Megavirus chiliensis]AFX92665.1 putative formamidopyrimidine-DNA glycosylase [Megavirus courdo11]AVG46318.1 formamidopyrimidine-DNA glycosylase [Acanthamoeba polyphaga mimivirus]AVL93914.1 putative formamidopyrimidine-DNA glycosylase [Megavirus vitis]AEQ32986.1 putative formamidopyrimidine-DNA glycosylase [Megavirus chiliensis]AVG47429.1 formamidopyrimidine-DNA glycosylase [Acanthamoeba polyphaga mimivirus]